MCTKCLLVPKLSMKNVMRCVGCSIRDFYTRLGYFSSGFYIASTFLRVYMPCTSGTPQPIKRSATCKTYHHVGKKLAEEVIRIWGAAGLYIVGPQPHEMLSGPPSHIKHYRGVVLRSLEHIVLMSLAVRSRTLAALHRSLPI